MSAENPSLDQLKKTHEQLAFVHAVFTQRTQYFLDEVEVAKDSARTLTDITNKLADEIKAQINAASEIPDETA